MTLVRSLTNFSLFQSWQSLIHLVNTPKSVNKQCDPSWRANPTVVSNDLPSFNLLDIVTVLPSV